MKRLIVFLIIFILFTGVLSAGEMLQEKLEVRLKSGMFVPGKAVKSVYEEDITYSAELIAWLSDEMGVSIAVQSYESSYDSYSYKSDISITPITANFLYRAADIKHEVKPYYGIGVGLYNVKEKVEEDDENYSSQDTGLGISTKCGIKVRHFFLEISYSSSQVLIAFANGNNLDINAGGLSICAGISFGR